jgi:hypothetical protein
MGLAAFWRGNHLERGQLRPARCVIEKFNSAAQKDYEGQPEGVIDA